ncbi:hypothetical protein Ahy_B01g053022 [Arachis hypogaea]|uniref:40S ribosomal protein S13 n=1 Tax=Arachis hypogaea TaxID=3818 RepID=A0A445AR01_ARAHY|nr:hypothetical protein Ahy_B01g053022 [Arachis hypogaea]
MQALAHPIYAEIANQAGGYENVNYTLKDMRHALNDAKVALKYLKNQKAEDPCLYYKHIGKTLVSVIIDSSPSIKFVIEAIFLINAHHRLCAWHLIRNATTLLTPPHFTDSSPRLHTLPSKCSIGGAFQPCTAVAPFATAAPNLHCTELPLPPPIAHSAALTITNGVRRAAIEEAKPRHSPGIPTATPPPLAPPPQSPQTLTRPPTPPPPPLSQDEVVTKQRNKDGVRTMFESYRCIKLFLSKKEVPFPLDLYHLIKKAVSIRKHLERNRKDKDSKFRLILVESRIHRLACYYKKTKKLPPVSRYHLQGLCLQFSIDSPSWRQLLPQDCVLAAVCAVVALVNGLGYTRLEDENMEAALEQVLDGEREDVIELVLRLVEEVVTEHPQSLGRCNQIWRGDKPQWRRQ